MPIVVNCSACASRFRAKDALAGKQVPCPKCKTSLLVEGPRVPEFDVFVSHSFEDADAAKAVCHALEERRIRCWIAPRDIPPGKKWAAAIVDGLSESRVMLLLLTEDAVISQQVMNEIEQAVQQNLAILPVRLKDVQLTTEMSYFISRSHWLDAFPEPLDEYVAHIVKSVRALLNDDDADEPRVPMAKPRRTARENASSGRSILLPLLLLASLATAGFFGWKWYDAQSSQETVTTQPANAEQVIAVNEPTPSEILAQPDSTMEFTANDPQMTMIPAELEPRAVEDNPSAPVREQAAAPIANVPIDPVMAERPTLDASPPPAPTTLVSESGAIDFAKSLPGSLPADWDGDPVIQVRRGTGAPALQPIGQRLEAAASISRSVTLGGDFFVEMQLRGDTYHIFQLTLNSSTSRDSFDLFVEMQRGQAWTVYHNDRSTAAKSWPNKSADALWVRLEHTLEHGFIVIPNGNRRESVRIGSPALIPFDQLSVTFPEGDSGREVQNLRWGSLAPNKPAETVAFRTSTSKRGPNGIPDGWIRLSGDNGTPQRLAARDLTIGDPATIELELAIKGYCRFSLNLIGREGAMSIPIVFDFRRQKKVIAADLETAIVVPSGNVQIRLRRDGPHAFLELSGVSDPIGLDASEWGTFDAIELDLIDGVDQLAFLSLPEVKSK